MLAVSWWVEERGWIYSQYNEASSGVIIFLFLPWATSSVSKYLAVCSNMLLLPCEPRVNGHIPVTQKGVLLHKQLNDELSYFILQL